MRGKETGAEEPGAQLFERIYRIVNQIPRGRVATYGQVALIAGAPTPRIVGFAMAGLPQHSTVPWHRVINSQGRLAIRKDGGESPEQARLLRAEGVIFDRLGRVDFNQVAWPGPSWQWLEENGFDLEAITLRSQDRRRTGAWLRWGF